jgi:hypothetical protein
VGLGAVTLVQGNLVSGHSYTGSGEASSGGVLLYGGACFGGSATVNTLIQQNTAIGNDVGIYMVNLDVNCNPVATATKNTAFANALVNNAINNTTGDVTEGYQAGIDDQGDGDVIANNYICGLGYTSPSTATAVTLPIDTTDTNHPVVVNNTICPSIFAGPEVTAGANAAVAKPSGHPQPSPIK